jgi:hypothetical protein
VVVPVKAFTVYLPNGDTLNVHEFEGRLVITGSQPLIIRPASAESVVIELEN